MKKTHTITTIGAAACCAVMSSAACLAGEMAADFSLPPSRGSLAAIPSADADWTFSLSAGWSGKYVTEGLEWSPAENVTVAPLVRYGYNGGYNTGYADGSNCIDWSLGVTWKFAEHYSLSGSVNYSQGAMVLRRRDAGDEFWAAFRLGVEF